MTHPSVECGCQTPWGPPHLSLLSGCRGCRAPAYGLEDCPSGPLGNNILAQLSYAGLPLSYHSIWTWVSCDPEGNSLEEKPPGKTETPERPAGVGILPVQAGVSLAALAFPRTWLPESTSLEQNGDADLFTQRWEQWSERRDSGHQQPGGEAGAEQGPVWPPGGIGGPGGPRAGERRHNPPAPAPRRTGKAKQPLAGAKNKASPFKSS